MEQNKENKLKKLIQQIEPDQPSVGFTENLMQQIETQESLVINPALQTLLSQHLVESPSIDFTEKVMKGIVSAEQKTVYEPVISKKAWYSIGIAATLILTLAGFLGKSSKATNMPSVSTNEIMHITGQVIAQINAIPVVLLASSFAIVALLILDYFAGFRRRYEV